MLAQRDIRLLQTEIGTRGRLAQLERWNVKVLALSAPSADQFLEGGFQLARLGRPEPTPAVDAPVVLASAPAPNPQPRRSWRASQARLARAPDRSQSAAQLMREASFKIPVRETAAMQEPIARPQPKAAEAASRQTTRKLGELAKPVEKAR